MVKNDGKRWSENQLMRQMGGSKTNHSRLCRKKFGNRAAGYHQKIV